MPGIHPRHFMAALLVLIMLTGFSVAGEIHSTMRNVNAVMEAQGFRLTPVYDVEPPVHPGDLAPTQVFEIERPLERPVTIGRLFTSCSCIQLETNKRTFRPGERAILYLRNIRPTPENGQLYAIFVQITSPIRTTLRFDTFVQTGSGAPPVIASQEATDGGDDDDENDAPLISTSTEEDDAGTAAFLVEGAPADAGDESGATESSDLDEYFQAETTPATAGDDAFAGELPDFDAGAASMPLAEAAPEAADSSAETRGEEPEAPETGTAEAEDAAVEFPAAVAPPSQAEEPPARDPEARKPVQMVSLITIGVRDMQAAMSFYEGLGWRRAARGKYDQTAFFQLQGQILALYPMNDLLREQNMAGATPAPGGITLALHVSDKADVWAVYGRFVEAGGTSLRAPTEMASGAVSCYVADPDGNAWEISWVPHFRMDDEGGLWLP